MKKQTCGYSQNQAQIYTPTAMCRCKLQLCPQLSGCSVLCT